VDIIKNKLDFEIIELMEIFEQLLIEIDFIIVEVKIEL
jgi:hypothetical protein